MVNAQSNQSQRLVTKSAIFEALRALTSDPNAAIATFAVQLLDILVADERGITNILTALAAAGNVADKKLLMVALFAKAMEEV